MNDEKMKGETCVDELLGMCSEGFLQKRKKKKVCRGEVFQYIKATKCMKKK